MTSNKADLEARVLVLEKLVDKLYDCLAVSRVAEKTADKALQMAQEALVIITSYSKAQAPTPDPLGFDDGLADKVDFTIPESPAGTLGQFVRGKKAAHRSDEELNGDLEKGMAEDA